MNLVDISKELLNEAPKNPLGLFRNIFKAAGVDFAEAEAALLLGLRQIDKNITTLSKATPEQLEKAFKTTAFRPYGKVIARNYVANNDKIIEGILKKHPINTTKGSKDARFEIANTLGINKSLADEVFVLKRPKKITTKSQPTPSTNTPTPSSTINLTDSDLWSFFEKEFKDNRIKKFLNKQQGELFVREIKPIIEKTLREQFPKMEVKLTDLRNKWSMIPPTKQQKILQDTQESIKKLGLKKGMSLKSIEFFNKSLFDYVKGMTSKEKLYASLFMSGLSFGLDGLVYIDEKELKGHFGLPFHTTGILKLLAAAGGFIAGGWPGIILSTILLIDSSVSGIKDVVKHISSTKNEPKQTNLEKGKEIGKKGLNTVDSVYKTDIKPVIDTTAQKVKNYLNTKLNKPSDTTKPKFDPNF